MQNKQQVATQSEQRPTMQSDQQQCEEQPTAKQGEQQHKAKNKQ